MARSKRSSEGEPDERHSRFESGEQERDPKSTRWRDADRPERCSNCKRVKAERDNERDELGNHKLSVSGDPRLNTVSD
jgi:hypothetical protein